MRGEVPKAGQRTSRLPEETPGCSHSQSLGVFCFLLLCHRDLAARVIFAHSLAQWPEAGTVKRKQQKDIAWLGPRHPPAVRGVPNTGSEDVKMLRFGAV